MSKSSLSRKIYFPHKSAKNYKLVILIIPVILVFLSSLLIGSTQRNGFQELPYQHLIAGGFGVIFALIFAQLHLDKSAFL